MERDYSDIMGLPHWEPKRHPRMPRSARAAQFAPFAALSGHDEAIAETGRRTEERIELDGDARAEINRALLWLSERLTEGPEAEALYFEADRQKAGGSCLHHRGVVSRIDEWGQLLVFADGKAVPLPSLLSLSIADASFDASSV